MPIATRYVASVLSLLLLLIIGGCTTTTLHLNTYRLKPESVQTIKSALVSRRTRGLYLVDPGTEHKQETKLIGENQSVSCESMTALTLQPNREFLIRRRF